ncbi:MAG: MoaD/ThiS family protein [Nitrososphaerales archaeon]
MKIVGSLGKLPDGRKLEAQIIKGPSTVGSLLGILQTQHGIEIRRDSTLVIVNGVEARALSDLETVVNPGDEVVLVPMFHGG